MARRYLLESVLLVAGLLCAQLAAQTSVTPTLMPTPPGTLIMVNNALNADHYDPHVSSDVLAYSTQVNTALTIRYFDLITGVDATVPNPGVFDYLSDVRGSVIAFTRVDPTRSAIFTFDTVSPMAAPVEVAPQPGSSREVAQIGDSTIAWQDHGFYGSPILSDIVAYDRASGNITRLTDDGNVNRNPALSPDGSVIAWEKCVSDTACDMWSATRSGANWTPHQLTTGYTCGSEGGQDHPDTDGQIVAYSCNRSGQASIYWQPVAGGLEQVLNFAGDSVFPSVSGGVIVFANRPSGATNHNLYVFNTASANLYQTTNDTQDHQLNDVSYTPDGKVRVVWEVGQLAVYAFTFTLPVGDFSIGTISPLTISAGGSASTNVIVDPLNGFDSAVNLSVTGQPAGVTATLVPSQVTPTGGNPAGSTLTVTLPLFMMPTSFNLTVTGTSGPLSHSASANVTVTATSGSVTNLIGGLVGRGCIDKSGIGNALASKLSAAQSAINSGNVQTAINILTALKSQIQAQAAKHIATSCTMNGVSFNPVAVLLADVQGMIDSLRVSLIPDPITGYIVDPNGIGVAGATVSILDSTGTTVIAQATTDITGFYFFATTGVLGSGVNYTIAVTGLAGFTAATPASQPFTWAGSAQEFDFALK